jgi:hypothetical protein
MGQKGGHMARKRYTAVNHGYQPLPLATRAVRAPVVP